MKLLSKSLEVEASRRRQFKTSKHLANSIEKRMLHILGAALKAYIASCIEKNISDVLQ